LAIFQSPQWREATVGRFAAAQTLVEAFNSAGLAPTRESTTAASFSNVPIARDPRLRRAEVAYVSVLGGAHAMLGRRGEFNGLTRAWSRQHSSVSQR
jgi:hypothetical protein